MTEIHTLTRDGQPAEFYPTVHDYAARHDYALCRWGESDAATLPGDVFLIRHILSEFVGRDREWCVFVDADVWVAPNAPSITERRKPGFHVCIDTGEHAYYPIWAAWCKGHKLEQHGDWQYRNTGVWVCDRQTARDLLKIIKLPYFEGLNGRHHLNWWLYQLRSSGGKLETLNRKWNSCVPRGDLRGWIGGHCLNFQGSKSRKLQEVSAAGGFKVFVLPG